MKKLVRSVELLMPHVSEHRYEVEQRLLRLMGKVWRADVLGLKYLDHPAPEVLDIGANRGFCISAIQMLLPKARITAFEPFPRLADRLKRRFGPSGVRVEPVALGAEAARLPLYVPVYRGMPLDTLSSLEHAMASGWLDANRIYWFDGSKLEIDKIDVEVRPLDEYGLAPDVVKMYAQSFEPAIVAGGEQTFLKHQPVVLAPSYSPELEKRFRDLGYERYAYVDGKFLRGGKGDYFSWYLTPKGRERLRAPVVDAARA